MPARKPTPGTTQRFPVGHVSGHLRITGVQACTPERNYLLYDCLCLRCGETYERNSVQVRRCATILRGGGCRVCKALITEALHGAFSARSTADKKLTYPYSKWARMRLGCRKPTAQLWPYYGGRGRRLCDEWDASFDAFIQDVGPPPSDYHVLLVDRSAKVIGPGTVQWGYLR